MLLDSSNFHHYCRVPRIHFSRLEYIHHYKICHQTINKFLFHASYPHGMYLDKYLLEILIHPLLQKDHLQTCLNSCINDCLPTWVYLVFYSQPQTGPQIYFFHQELFQLPIHEECCFRTFLNTVLGYSNLLLFLKQSYLALLPSNSLRSGLSVFLSLKFFHWQTLPQTQTHLQNISTLSHEVDHSKLNSIYVPLPKIDESVAIKFEWVQHYSLGLTFVFYHFYIILSLRSCFLLSLICFDTGGMSTGDAMVGAGPCCSINASFCCFIASCLSCSIWILFCCSSCAWSIACCWSIWNWSILSFYCSWTAAYSVFKYDYVLIPETYSSGA